MLPVLRSGTGYKGDCSGWHEEGRREREECLERVSAGSIYQRRMQRTLANSFASPPLELIFLARLRRERLEMSGCYWMDSKRMVTCRVGPLASQVVLAKSFRGLTSTMAGKSGRVLVCLQRRLVPLLRLLVDDARRGKIVEGSRRGASWEGWWTFFFCWCLSGLEVLLVANKILGAASTSRPSMHSSEDRTVGPQELL